MALSSVNLADKIVMRPVGALVPYASNSRTHTPEQISLIARSIKTFGFTNPILVDGKNGVVAGHARLKAALKLGLAEVPTIELAWLTAEERQAYIIADNQTAIAGAGWDPEMLRLELGDLKLAGFDLSLTGFGELELDSLLADKTEGLTDPDDTPALPEHTVSQTGDLWLLGKHRLLCGDSTVATDVERVMDGTSAQMIFTDPPYGVDYKGGAKRREQLASDNVGTNIYADALPLLAGAADNRAPLYLWYADGHAAAAAAAAAGYGITAQIIWAKNHAQFATSAHYKGKHESCYYAHRRGHSARWHGPNNEVTLWEYDRAPRNDFHPTQKPVVLAERAIANSTQTDQVVLDGFLGSGSTMIAAEISARRCYAMELAPKYIDVAVMRWQDFTGTQATLDGDGRTFDEIAATRLPSAADAA